MAKENMTVAEFAAMKNATPQAVYNWLREGRIMAPGNQIVRMPPRPQVQIPVGSVILSGREGEVLK